MKQQTTAAPSTPLAMLEIVKLNEHFFPARIMDYGNIASDRR